MRLQLLSDLHLEFCDYSWSIPYTEADVIILAGDIGVGSTVIKWAVNEAERLHKRIIYVMGNHEFYRQEMYAFLNEAYTLTASTGVDILENRAIEIDGIQIVGGTLWTDYELYGDVYMPLAQNAAMHGMNDHRLITVSDGIKARRFTTKDALSLHTETMQVINSALQKNVKSVVVTHHAPVPGCCNPKYDQDLLSAAFASDLSGFIAERSPALWAFGHTHYNVDMKVFDTRVVCNQKGYPLEEVDDFNSSLIIEI